MNQTEVANRLAVEHLACRYCNAQPGEPCRIVKKRGDAVASIMINLVAGLPRPVPHELRRAPFMEAWAEGYMAAEVQNVQARR